MKIKIGRKRSGKQSDNGKRADTRHLTRILIILKEFKRPMNYSELKDYTRLSVTLSDGLNWLKNRGLIEKKRTGGTVEYSLKWAT